VKEALFFLRQKFPNTLQGAVGQSIKVEMVYALLEKFTKSTFEVLQGCL
jgi:hypothetical protein